MKKDKAYEQKISRIKELSALLNKASLTYYQEGHEIMPNIEYDRDYDELLTLENETGFRLSNSPTQHVGYELISELPKERHERAMLSLDKTKDPDALLSWMNTRPSVLSWKLDGITCVVTYENGKLSKAVTRGNGEIGEVVTPNARFFENLPGSIPFKGKLVIRGEAVISYSDFEKINAETTDIAARYKNPRNLCSGSVRQLDPKVTRDRHVKLIVFSLVSAKAAETTSGTLIPPDINNSFMASFDWLSQLGFEVVSHVLVTPDTLKSEIEHFKEKIPSYDIPSDGLVLAFEDIAYGESLGRTAKFPRGMIAFKWQDELAKTTLRKIDWSGSRTGLINPVAVFDPVELEGTTVSRACVHNVSIVRELKLGIGDTITVYKSNMIIPQINENLTKSGTAVIPSSCPVCGGPTEIRSTSEAKLLYCVNSDCPAKKVKSFAHLVSRNALNIEGLSEHTLEKLIDEGFIKEYADIFKLSRYKNKIASLPGFGEKSADNLIKATQNASRTDVYRWLYGLGIPGIGLSGSRSICRAFHNDPKQIINADIEKLKEIQDIGDVLAGNFVAFFEDETNLTPVLNLLHVLSFRTEESVETEENQNILNGKTFVITGDVYHYKNRDELKELILSLGGKATGTVSSKTDYLINNNPLSTSGKNKKAKELGVTVISEKEFIDLLPSKLRPHT